MILNINLLKSTIPDRVNALNDLEDRVIELEKAIFLQQVEIEVLDALKISKIEKTCKKTTNNSHIELKKEPELELPDLEYYIEKTNELEEALDKAIMKKTSIFQEFILQKSINKLFDKQIKKKSIMSSIMVIKNENNDAKTKEFDMERIYKEKYYLKVIDTSIIEIAIELGKIGKQLVEYNSYQPSSKENKVSNMCFFNENISLLT